MLRSLNLPIDSKLKKLLLLQSKKDFLLEFLNLILQAWVYQKLFQVQEIPTLRLRKITIKNRCLHPNFKLQRSLWALASPSLMSLV